MWQAKFYKSLPKIVDAYPKARWMFLTLTVRNCPVDGLKNTLKDMNSAWERLRLRKEFLPVLGWVRATEVTRGKDGSAHPHFHALMMVPSSMLAGVNYVRQSRWGELWQECGRLDYSPMVDIRAVKPRDLNSGQTPIDATAFLRGAVSETLKYAVKPSDMTTDPAWFLEMTRQVHKLRFVATGGALKDVLRVQDEDEEMNQGEGEGADDGSRLSFSWRPSDKRYRRTKRGDN
jgi:plasmid rolling circle replication initiator protein Rep